MRATLSDYRQSTRKTKLLADLVRGKSVTDALQTLTFTHKKASEAFVKLINSAVANARQQGMHPENLFIKVVTVNQARALKRMMPMARGRANRIKKGASHLMVELAAKTEQKPKKKAAKKTTKKSA
jgi:large subunit ribosomal protein L22